MPDCTPPEALPTPQQPKSDGGETWDHGHATQAACDAIQDRQANCSRCQTCASAIERHDDHGFIFHLCPTCDRKLRDDLVSEREFELREERIVRERGW